jgi:hypothetical protein
MLIDFRFTSTEFRHKPTRVNVCDGMCCACAADGAIDAYRAAAVAARDASPG